MIQCEVLMQGERFFFALLLSFLDRYNYGTDITLYLLLGVPLTDRLSNGICAPCSLNAEGGSIPQSN